MTAPTPSEPSLSLRGLSDQTYEGLRQLASSNHRSMQEQLLIEREVHYAQVGGLERARRWPHQHGPNPMLLCWIPLPC